MTLSNKLRYDSDIFYTFAAKILNQNLNIMKRILFVLLLNFCAIAIFAQDIIIMRDATEIEAKVLTVGVNEISYKKWNFQDGPTYQIDKKDVFYIKYSNGDKDIITPFNEQSEQAKSDGNSNTQTFGKYIHRTLFSSYLESGCPFTAGLAGPSFNATFGARFFDYGFAGLTVGMDVLFSTRHQYTYYNTGHAEYYTDDFGTLYFANYPSIMVDLRAFLPLKQDFSPFFEFSFGANILLLESDLFSDVPVGARYRLGAGIEYKRFVCGMGYDCITLSGKSLNMGYAKLGVKIGYMK